MSRLQIYNRRERALVSAADRAFAAAAAAARPFRRRRMPDAPRRILLLRLERIGDLLMALPAIADVRALAPGADIDLVVGSWNAELAGAVPAVTRVITLDAAWLARTGSGRGLAALLGSAWKWRATAAGLKAGATAIGSAGAQADVKAGITAIRRAGAQADVKAGTAAIGSAGAQVGRYNLAINFEPDVRSNLLLAASGAAWTAGYRNGGGGALLDVALEYEPGAHTTDNARRLVATVFGRTPPVATGRTLLVPDTARADAARRLDGAHGPLVGVHVSGGRAIKQWEPARFADLARRLITSAGATIVLTGSPADRPLVESVAHMLPADRVIDAAGDLDLLTVAALLERLALLVTGDTGPMHLAVAVGAPVVAVFGPSDPRRYAPRGPHDRVVRVDLPCSPCNRIRLPPARCVGHTPDCLALLSADSVFTAAMAVLGATRQERAPSPTPFA